MNFEHTYNYYELLDIDIDAKEGEIKKAYRKKLKEWHPDKNASRLEAAEEMTKVLNHAFHILSNPEKRHLYNRMLKYTRKSANYKNFAEDQFYDKFSAQQAPFLKRIFSHANELYTLFKDSIKGNYKLHPANIGFIGGGLLYFIIPFDFIPDILPIIGLIDDKAISSIIINLRKEELKNYRIWKKGK